MSEQITPEVSQNGLNLQGTSGNDSLLGGVYADSIRGAEGDDTILGQSGDDSLYGDAGADFLLGSEGKDQLWGGDGDDELWGSKDNDTLEGGAGNDYLFGGPGADVYKFGKGSGQDSIDSSDNDAIDRIELGAGIQQADVSLLREHGTNDLQIKLNGTEDSLTVWDYFVGDSSQGIGQIQFADGSSWSVTDVKAKTVLSFDTDNHLVGSEAGDSLHGEGGNDWIWGEAGDDSLYGDAGNDVLSGAEGNDKLWGGEGDDQLHGEWGNDTLNGGTGNDYLLGGSGNDVYQFGKGSGQDVIDNSDWGSLTANSSIELGAGILASDVSLLRQDNDLLISLNGSEDSLRVVRYFAWDANSSYAIEQIKFADGSSWSIDDVKAKAVLNFDGDDWLAGSEAGDSLHGEAGNDHISGEAGDDSLYGDAGNDVLSGSEGKDKLWGGDGDDQLWGEWGNDTLNGGAGNDWLVGGSGEDVYQFGQGSGQDRITNSDWESQGPNSSIELGAGIKPTDVSLVREQGSDDLQIRLNGSQDILWVKDYFWADASSNSTIAQIKFADGSSWSIEDVKAKTLLSFEGNNQLVGSEAGDSLHGEGGNDLIWGEAGDDSLYGDAGDDVLSGSEGKDKLWGGDGNDTILGEWGNDTLDGGAGNDSLLGGSGNDVYRFGKGSGQDTIDNSSWDQGVSSSIELGAGIKPADISLLRQHTDLLIQLAGTEDSLRVVNYFAWDASSSYAVAQIQFADGSSWSVAEVQAKAVLNFDGDDQLVGTAAGDSLRGQAGSDLIWGESGDDSLYGDAGNDVLSGSEGNDKLWGGDGDDQLWGEWGNDTLEGGAGNDVLRGGSGADVYQFGKGSGFDWVDNSDDDALGEQADTLQLAAGIGQQDVTLSRQNLDLQIHLNGTDDTVNVFYYFAEEATSSYAIEQIRFADGSSWSIEQVKAKVAATEAQALESQLDGLVSAMAAFAPASAAQSSLPADYQAALTSVIAVS